MQFYLGTKAVNGKPMTRQEYNDFRGWQLPADENGADDGYLVEYLDGGEPNTDTYAGYVSWSPKEQFENAYQASGEMSFGHAVELMKKGHKVARSGWNGKGMYLVLILPHEYSVENFPLEEAEDLDAFVALRTATKSLIPWNCSQADALANDWLLVE
jgi:hypothetical protein